MSFSPLAGIRILDLTSVVVGPACTWRLGQYGAEIIKVESPEGDLMRGLGGASPTGQHSGAYLHLNRGKRNICLDLKLQSALEVLWRLIETSDVVVANMRPKALEKLGIDAESVRKKFPEKIYCLITGYGSEGPYAGQPVYDSVVQGVSGIANLFTARDGTPSYVPLLICDHVVGEITAGAILAAILQQKTTGTGSTLEVPMFETMSAFVLQEHLAQDSFVPAAGTIGDQRVLSPHNKPVQTADGWISVTVNTDAQVKAFLKATERESLTQDERFSTVANRAKYVKEWFEIRGAALTQHGSAQWLERLQAADIAAKPCHTLDSLQSDEHLAAVKLVSTETHPTEGKTKTIRSSIKVNNNYLDIRFAAQPKGGETTALLSELGYSPEQIHELNSGASIASDASTTN